MAAISSAVSQLQRAKGGVGGAGGASGSSGNGSVGGGVGGGGGAKWPLVSVILRLSENLDQLRHLQADLLAHFHAHAASQSHHADADAAAAPALFASPEPQSQSQSQPQPFPPCRGRKWTQREVERAIHEILIHGRVSTVVAQLMPHIVYLDQLGHCYVVVVPWSCSLLAVRIPSFDFSSCILFTLVLSLALCRFFSCGCASRVCLCVCVCMCVVRVFMCVCDSCRDVRCSVSQPLQSAS